jgi:hypothetical protein
MNDCEDAPNILKRKTRRKEAMSGYFPLGRNFFRRNGSAAPGWCYPHVIPINAVLNEFF